MSERALSTKYINFLNDWGFKYLFKREERKDLLIKFLNTLLKGEKNIISIEYQDSDIQSEEEEGRNCSFDIICTDQNGERYIIEMQYTIQKFIMDRSLYYACKLYSRSGKKGRWDYSVKGIISINLLNFELSEEPNFRSDYEILNRDYPERKIEKLKLIFLQIPRISDNFENCVSELEQWIYLLKNITTMEYKSIGALKEEFQKILDLAKASALTDSEKAAYEESEKHYRDYVNTISYAEEKGIERGRTEGLEEGMAKGKAEEKLAVAKAMKIDGLSLEVISKYTNLSIKEIEKL
jgi:predicted transposase/invertase (TIGR01784 family)